MHSYIYVYITYICAYFYIISYIFILYYYIHAIYYYILYIITLGLGQGDSLRWARICKTDEEVLIATR